MDIALYNTTILDTGQRLTDTIHAVSKKMVTGGVSRGEHGAEFVARVRGLYLVSDLDCSTTEDERSSEGENPVTNLDSSSMDEGETSSEGKSHEIVTIQDNGSGQTKCLNSKIVKEDILAKGHNDPHQVVADARYNVFMVSEWLRLRRA